MRNGMGRGAGSRVIMGVADYADSASVTTPVSLIDSATDLTNDGLGAASDSSSWFDDIGEIYDPATGEFDFSELNIGDSFDIRLNCTSVAAGLNTQIAFSLDMAIGGSPYSINFGNPVYLLAGSFQFTNTISIYIRDANTRDNPAKFSALSSSATGDALSNIGWFIRCFRRV